VELVQAGLRKTVKRRAEAFCEEVMGLILHTIACRCMTQGTLRVFAHAGR
jgi:hypothetical protein